MKRTASVIAVVGAGLALLATVAGITQAQSPTTKPSKEQQIEAKLSELAHIASVVVDGEVCKNLVTDRAERLMFKVDPEDPYAGSDNYDVHLEPFQMTKKLLARVALLSDFPVDCNLIVRSRTNPQVVQTVIRQYYGWSQCYQWAAMTYDPTPEMKRVLDAGDQVVLRSKTQDYVSAMAPVRDSLGQIIGFVEVCTRTDNWHQARQ